ncbi:MAG: hypothetical protein C0594_09365 [Marinilabiliales bacterium]|nr:MAG: hypothetical protein C0594_09365 [Marinilabiliales bacterium]
MKKVFNVLIVAVVLSLIGFTACQKEELYEETQGDSMIELATSTYDLTLKTSNAENGDYEKVIVNPLIKGESCKFIVSGTIEYRINGEVVATVDYGNGECDNIATKTIGDQTIVFELNKKSDKSAKEKKKWFGWSKYKKEAVEYEKVIVNPLVKIDDCDYIVEGTVEFYDKYGLVCTIDFGDGECDEWATKITSDGEEIIWSQEEYMYNK